MKITVFERGMAYQLFIPPADIREVAEKCGLDAFDAAEDKSPHDEMMIALLKAEQEEFLEKAAGVKIR